MRNSIQRITSFLKLLAFVSAICALLVQPTIQSLYFLGHTDFELVDMDTEKDSNEKENQEEDKKDSKVELQLSSSSYLTSAFIKESSIFSEQNLKWDFTLETHLPPPEQV